MNGNERKKETTGQDTCQINRQTSDEKDKAKRKEPDPSEYTTETTNSTTDSNGCKNALMTSKATNAVAFHIPIEQPVCRPPPKRFCDQVKSERENISIERLTEKQKMAERRKKQHVEQRLKRIHDRQEAARKLAHNVELLLQQKSLMDVGRGENHNTPKMTSSELLTTARHVAKDFRTLTSQMTKDFAVDDKNNNSSKGCQRQVKPTCQKENHTTCSSAKSLIKNDNNRSVAFTVGFDDDKQPVSPIPKALQVPYKKKEKSKLTAEELDEKLRKAAERRNHRQQERVKQVRANREALFKLASDLETFMLWNDAERTDDSGRQQRHQTRQLANDIADGFDRLSQRYSRDLKRAEGFPCTVWEAKQ
ncbi:uncharacterized protein LOC144647475 isoform X2 [Oculina patagonica]